VKQVEAACNNPADPEFGKRMFAGLDSKFQRLEKPGATGGETKESEPNMGLLESNPVAQAATVAETPPPKEAFDSAAVMRAAAAVGVAAASDGKRVRPSGDAKAALQQVLSTSSDAIAEFFLRRSYNDADGGVGGSPRLRAKLSARLFQAVAGELMLHNAVSLAAEPPVYGPPPNPRDLQGLVDHTVALFANARIGKPGFELRPPPYLSALVVEDLHTPMAAATATAAATMMMTTAAEPRWSSPPPRAESDALSPRSAGRFLDGSVRAAGAGRSTGRFLDHASSAGRSSNLHSSRSRSSGAAVVDLAGSSAAAQRFKAGNAAAATAAARTATAAGNRGRADASRSTPPRRGLDVRGASEPRGLKPALPRPSSREGSLEERFQTERRLLPPKSRPPPPLLAPGYSSKWGATRGGGGRLEQDLGGSSGPPRAPPPLPPPPRADVGLSSSSSSSYSYSTLDSSGSSSLGGSVGSSSGVARGGPRAASTHLKDRSSVGNGESAAAWQQVVALLAADDGAARALEAQFMNAPHGWLDVDALALSLFESGLRLKGGELRAFHADCDAHGNGVTSLEQFMLALHNHRNRVAPASGTAE